MSKKPLNFIHISRTGGLSIVATGGRRFIGWIKGKDHHKPFTLLPKEEKDAYDWFTVVRNPYTRILSDYAWCDKCIFNDPRVGDKDYFNQFLVNWITNLNSDTKLPMMLNRGEYHFTECYKYIDTGYPIRILRYEALEEDFNALMADYGHTLTLGPKVNDIPNKPMGISDLYPETIELIKTVYARDFELFGYSTDPAKAADVPNPITFNQ